MFSTYTRPGEHDFEAFSRSFEAQVWVPGSGGQNSKVSLTSQIVYHIVRLDELSLLVKYFSDPTFLSQVTAKNNAKISKNMGLRDKIEILHTLL